MARSKVLDALTGFAQGYDAVNDIGQKMALRNLGNQTPTESVDPETGEKFTEFLGQKYAGSMTQQQIDDARAAGAADVVSRWSPLKGMDMRRGLRRDAREDKKFDQDMKVSNAQLNKMGQESSLLGFQVGKMKDDEETRGKRREFQQSLGKMKDAELADHLGSSFNGDGNTPAMLTYDDRTNRFMLSSKIPGVKSQSLTRAELLREATSAWEMGNGDFNTGLQMQLQGIQERHQRQREMVGDAKDMAHGNADLAWKQRNYALHLRQVEGQERRYDDEKSRPFGLQFGVTVGPDGKQSPGLTGLKWSTKTGKMEPFYQDLGSLMPGGGFVPESGLQGIEKVAMGMVDAPTGRTLPGGGAEKHTFDSALRAAHEARIRTYIGQRGGQNGGLDPAVLAKMPGFMDPAPARAPAPNAAQAVPAPQQQGIRATFGAGGLRLPAQQPAQGPQVMIQNGRPVSVFAPQPMSDEDALRYLSR